MPFSQFEEVIAKLRFHGKVYFHSYQESVRDLPKMPTSPFKTFARSLDSLTVSIGIVVVFEPKMLDDMMPTGPLLEKASGKLLIERFD